VAPSQERDAPLGNESADVALGDAEVVSNPGDVDETGKDGLLRCLHTVSKRVARPERDWVV
jgi:hypothetical protein